MVPMTGSLYTRDCRYLKVLGRATDAFPCDSPYRFISYLMNQQSDLSNLQPNQMKAVTNVRKLFNPSFLPPLWTPPSLTSEEMRDQRRQRVSQAFSFISGLNHDIQQQYCDDIRGFLNTASKEDMEEEQAGHMEEEDEIPVSDSDLTEDELMAESEEVGAEDEELYSMEMERQSNSTVLPLEYDIPEVSQQDGSSIRPSVCSSNASPASKENAHGGIVVFGIHI